MRLRARLRMGLLALGLGLLVTAWMMANQPWSGPDEASHYLRALSITHGQIIGRHVPAPPGPGVTPQQLAFVSHDTTAVQVPARLSPPNVKCLDGRPDVTGSCVEATPNGNFPPLAYLLPAAVLGASHSASTGIWLARVASALPSLAFLLLAVALLWTGAASSIIGLLLATTPMVLFVSSILNLSGLEITASLACAAAILRVARAPADVSRRVWMALGASGSVAILAGPLGVVFVAINVALLGVLLGRSGLQELARNNGRALRIVVPALGAAAAWALIYTRISGVSAHFGVFPVGATLKGGLHQLSPVLHDAVGTFGGLTVRLPNVAYWIWWLLVAALIAAGLLLGDRSDRVRLMLVLAVTLAFPVLFWAWVDRFSGSGLQGREVLPPLLLIPLVAGEVIHRRHATVRRARLAPLVLGGAVALVALFQAYAWWFNARFMAGAPGTIRFYAHAIWSPPLGWMPWIVAAALGTACWLAFAASELRLASASAEDSGQDTLAIVR